MNIKRYNFFSDVYILLDFKLNTRKYEIEQHLTIIAQWNTRNITSVSANKFTFLVAKY